MFQIMHLLIFIIWVMLKAQTAFSIQFNFPKNPQPINFDDPAATVPTITLKRELNQPDTTNKEFKLTTHTNKPLKVPKKAGIVARSRRLSRIDCLYLCAVSRCDKVLQRCRPNAKCTGTICVDKKKKPAQPPTTTSSFVIAAGSPGFNDSCPSFHTVCVEHNPCRSEQRCSMDENCTSHVCLDTEKNNTAMTTMTLIPDTTTFGGNCSKGSQIRCGHGVCVEKANTGAGGGYYSFCLCHKGWSEFHCDTPCTLDCGPRGTCRVRQPGDMAIPPENVTRDMMECSCQGGWEGDACQEKTPDHAALEAAAKRKAITIGASLGATLFLVLGLWPVTLYILWRKRVIIVMKLVYIFKTVEDNDGRRYDAYISMGTSHRGLDFVKNKLCPNLQDLGFNVFVQARDLMLGEVLPDSIHRSVQQSRRTILILTPEYIRNEWSNFEFIVALQDTLKHNQRIIPIVLEDISMEKRTMNKTLKHILDSVNCLKYPTASINETACLKQIQRKENKFWERLKLTMPKINKSNNKSYTDEPDTEVSDLDDIDIRDHRSIDVSTINTMYNTVV